MFERRINVFAGHYGSGKSEIAVNAAVTMKRNGANVVMADMDIVNPFFRSVDARNKLEGLGIRVVAPLFANTNVDVPALVPEISVALRSPDKKVILDVGGDEDGARVLGRYHGDISEGDFDMYFVINRARPLTREVGETIKYMEEIQLSSRLKVTWLINNTHFLNQTSIDDVKYGLELTRQVSEKTGVPIAATCLMDDLNLTVGNQIDTPLYRINKNILLPF